MTNLTKNKIKRRYFDFRTGNTTLSPILQFSNFMMLAYLTINEFLPMYIFAPVFIASILIAFTTIGAYFRKIQTPTDINMIYEKSTDAAETVVQMMEAELKIMNHLDITVEKEFITRLEYMKRISKNHV